MIRFFINELLSEKQFKEGRRVTLVEVSEATVMSRMTLSETINHRNHSMETDNLDKGSKVSFPLKFLTFTHLKLVLSSRKLHLQVF